MYNYGYPAAYYNSPYMQTYQQPQQAAQPAQSGGIPWVQGEAGAKAYSIGAGQSVLLMDSECQSFYIKSTDGSGMPLPLRIFDYTERTAQSAPTKSQTGGIDTSLFVTRSEFEERIAALVGASSTAKKTEGE